MIGSGKSGLAALGLATLLLLAGCGKEEETSSGQGASSTETTTVDSAMAADIQKETEEYLALIEGSEEQRLVSHQSVTVTPDGDAFAVTIGGLRMGSAGQGYLDIGDIGYRLKPKGDDLLTASGLSHADEFLFIETDGKPSGSLKLTTKTFAGEYSKSLNTFLSLDWQAADIHAVEKSTNGGEVRALTLAIAMASQDRGGGLYDQTGSFAMDGFAVTETSGETFLIGAIKGTYGAKSVKLKEYLEKSQAMQVLAARMAEEAEAAKPAADAANAQNTQSISISPERAKEMGDLIAGMSGLIDGMTYDVALADLSAKTKDGQESFHLATGKFAADISGLAGEKAGFDLSLGHDGLAIDAKVIELDPLFARLVPKSGKLALSLTDVPAKELWQVLAESMPGIAAAGGSRAEMAVSALFTAMERVIHQAPMKLTLDPSGLAADLIQLDADGAFDVKPQSVIGLVGKLGIAIHGIDETMAEASKTAETSPDAANVVTGLAMLQSVAKREQDGAGKPIDRLEIELTEAGAMLVNGKPISGP